MINFKVQINPFTKVAIINTRIRENQYTKIIYYNLNEWEYFEMDGKTFKINFYYDTEFLVKIYSVYKNKTDYNKPFKVELTFKLKE